MITRALIFGTVVGLTCQSLLGLNSDDHRRLSINVANAFGFTQQAAQLLGQAATEPDAYDWDTPSAHAQTPNDKSGVPTQSAAQAEADCARYLQQKATEFLAQLSAGNTGNAVYVLGYALHTVQDFAAHGGMTNFDHSYLSFHGHNPDADSVRIARAGQWTQDFMKAVQQNMSHCAWERLRGFTRRISETDHWRDMPTFALKKETADADYVRYWQLKFNDPNYSKNVMWLPLDGTYEALRIAFTSTGLRSKDDVAWLLEGEWTDDGIVKIKRAGTSYIYHRSTADYSWTMVRTDKKLSGEILMSAKDLESRSTPAFAIPQLLGKARKYLTLLFSEDSCMIDGRSEIDGAQGEYIDHKPTGRIRLVPKEPDLTKTYTLKVSE